MCNIRILIYTYFCGTGSDRNIKAYINHLIDSSCISFKSACCFYKKEKDFSFQNMKENNRSATEV